MPITYQICHEDTVLASGATIAEAQAALPSQVILDSGSGKDLIVYEVTREPKFKLIWEHKIIPVENVATAVKGQSKAKPNTESTTTNTTEENPIKRRKRRTTEPTADIPPTPEVAPVEVPESAQAPTLPPEETLPWEGKDQPVSQTSAEAAFLSSCGEEEEEEDVDVDEEEENDDSNSGLDQLEDMAEVPQEEPKLPPHPTEALAPPVTTAPPATIPVDTETAPIDKQNTGYESLWDMNTVNPAELDEDPDVEG